MSRYKYRDNKTDNGRIVIRYRGDEEPQLARKNWQLWLLCKGLELGDIQFLITKRRNQLKYENNPESIKILRTDIMILEDSYRIIKRSKEKEESKYE